MGTACKEGTHVGIIPRAMAALFDKIEKLKNQVDFQLRVSFIEVKHGTLCSNLIECSCLSELTVLYRILTDRCC